MKVLLLATRDPRGRAYGRKIVLRTIIASLRSLGHEVRVLAFGQLAEGPAGALDGIEIEALGVPSLRRITMNVLFRVTTGRMTLNEALFFSPRIARTIKARAAQFGADVIVCDMLRTTRYAEPLGIPWVVDLDDLLSERYSNLARKRSRNDQVLGFFGENLPRLLRRPLSAIAVRLLAFEARRIKARELEVVGAANAVTLVSHDECTRLAERSGRSIYCTPMAVEVNDIEPSPDVRAKIVFVGGLDFQPNIDALRWYASDVQPELKRLGLGDLVLDVVGYAPEPLRREFLSDRIRFAGYVEDLQAEVSRHQLFVAPIVSGTGIKTKIVEAMGMRVPVVTTTEGARGLGVLHGRECLIADDAASFAAAVRELLEQRDYRRALADRAFGHVRIHFSLQTIANSWRQIIDTAVVARQSTGD